MIGARLLRQAAFAAGMAGGLSGAAYGLLNGQSRHARRVIGPPDAGPLRADGVYLPDGSGPLARAESPEDCSPLAVAVLGDSSAAGLGADLPEEVPGARLARGMAEELERPVELTTYAIVGTTSQELAAQVDAMLLAPPRIALVIIGANDVTTRLPVATSAALLGGCVSRMVAEGVAVVVGTCPDLGAIRPIPQPLRSIARSWSLALGRAQRRSVEAAGGHAVPMADLLSPEFLTRPNEFFSPDHFHPSAAGYEAAAIILLPAMCAAIGEWTGAVPSAPTRSSAAEARRPTRRIVARLNQRFGRRSTE